MLESVAMITENKVIETIYKSANAWEFVLNTIDSS